MPDLNQLTAPSFGGTEGTTMARFRRKPDVVEVVEAFRFKDYAEPTWFKDAVAKSLEGGVGSVVLTADSAMVRTPEGDVSAFEGDWIIRSENGELSVCKPDLFAATYEPGGR